MVGLGAVGVATPQSSVTDSIVGTITDTNAAFVPGASVDALNTTTNAKLSGTTDTNGRYALNNLPTGQYTIQVMAKGFSPCKRDGVTVEAGRPTSMDIALQAAGQPAPLAPSGQPDTTGTAISIPFAKAAPSIDCSPADWDHAAKLEVSESNGILVRVSPNPDMLSSPPEEVREKLSTYRAAYELEWDAKYLYVRATIDERQIDAGHPTYPQESAVQTGGASLFLPDLLYDTAVLQVSAPSLDHWVTEMHMYVRPPGAKSPQWTFAGRDNNEEDFHLLEGKAVSCPRPGGYLVKAAVAWLSFPPDWRPVPGARAGLRLFVPLPYNQKLSAEDRSQKIFALICLFDATLQQ